MTMTVTKQTKPADKTNKAIGMLAFALRGKYNKFQEHFCILHKFTDRLSADKGKYTQ